LHKYFCEILSPVTLLRLWRILHTSMCTYWKSLCGHISVCHAIQMAGPRCCEV